MCTRFGLASLLLPLALSPARAAPVTGPQAAAELAGLTGLLQQAHPALDRYEPSGAFAARSRALQGELRPLERVDELALGGAVHALVAPVGDAHIAVSLPLYSDDAAPLSLLPLLPIRVAEGLAVDAGAAALPPDALLLAIDGQPIEGLLEGLSALAPVDGRDPAAARKAVEVDLPRYHALRFGMSPSYTLRYRSGGVEAELQVAGVDRLQLRALRGQRRVPAWTGGVEGPPDPSPRLYKNEAGHFILEVPSLGVSDLSAWAQAVSAALAQVDPEAPLILDLRGDLGGLRPNAHALVDPLVPGDPPPEWTEMRLRLRRTPRVRHGSLKWLFSTPEQLRDAPFEREQGAWVLAGDPLWPRPAPRLRHPGPVRLLVDERTGSAANGLVLMLKAARPDVLLVGRSLGGACDRHVGEVPGVFVGAHSGVAVLFSVVDAGHVHPAGCTPGRGLPPDLPVAPTLADLLAGRDPWMAAAEESLAAPL